MTSLTLETCFHTLNKTTGNFKFLPSDWTLYRHAKKNSRFFMAEGFNFMFGMLGMI